MSENLTNTKIVLASDVTLCDKDFIETANDAPFERKDAEMK